MLHRLRHSLKEDISTFIEMHYFNMIENDYKIYSKLDFLWPTDLCQSDLILNCQQHISEKVENYCNEKKLPLPNNEFYRNPSLPINEVFFTCPENRKRLESIILKKSIDIYDRADSGYVRMRPLGYGLNHNLSFGFGTLCFTWRNVPFNVPLIFWYPHRGWFPLFERNFTSYNG